SGLADGRFCLIGGVCRGDSDANQQRKNRRDGNQRIFIGYLLAGAVCAPAGGVVAPITAKLTARDARAARASLQSRHFITRAGTRTALNETVAEAAAWRHIISPVSPGRQVWFKNGSNGPQRRRMTKEPIPDRQKTSAPASLRRAPRRGCPKRYTE